ncbi:MAG: TetR family transcriptional regulator [Myxococcota bacterium]
MAAKKPKKTSPTSAERGETPRRAKTRELILETALECLREDGLAGTSATKIASRCELSWGVIQYHFGDRAGLLLALLGRTFEWLHDSVSEAAPVPSEPSDRLRLLVEAMWTPMSHPDYHILLDIQSELGRDRSHRSEVRKLAREIRGRIREMWRKAFSGIPTAEVDRAERLATLGLQGIALERRIVGPRAEHREDVESLISAVASALRID